MARFKVYAYIFGGIFLILSMIVGTIRELVENDSYDGFIFGGIFVFIRFCGVKLSFLAESSHFRIFS